MDRRSKRKLGQETSTVHPAREAHGMLIFAYRAHIMYCQRGAWSSNRFVRYLSLAMTRGGSMNGC